jgi:hypothetical protein
MSSLEASKVRVIVQALKKCLEQLQLDALKLRAKAAISAVLPALTALKELGHNRLAHEECHMLLETQIPARSMELIISLMRLALSPEPKGQATAGLVTEALFALAPAVLGVINLGSQYVYSPLLATWLQQSVPCMEDGRPGKSLNP